jgi:predicted amidohydrolase
MHIVYGTRENATTAGGAAAVYNTAVVLDRRGEIAGTYRKVFPFSGPANHPGEFRRVSRMSPKP